MEGFSGGGVDIFQTFRLIVLAFVFGSYIPSRISESLIGMDLNLEAIESLEILLFMY